MSEKEMDRREFLRSAATGLGAFVFLPPASQRAGLSRGAQQRDPKNYPQRVLGKTGIRLPVITMGVMNSDNPSLIQRPWMPE